jgi:hypothetical protein
LTPTWKTIPTRRKLRQDFLVFFILVDIKESSFYSWPGLHVLSAAPSGRAGDASCFGGCNFNQFHYQRLSATFWPNWPTSVRVSRLPAGPNEHIPGRAVV